MYILANMWFQKLMRQFFFNIDKIVFNFISTIYDLLISIARTSVLSQADIIDMADRIYKLLAIFMIFKVTFSLIMYVVNPDDFSDKSKGVSKLGTNIIISLTLLILTPYIFSYAYQLQTIILEDNSIAALIFGDNDVKVTGDENDTGNRNNFLNSAGDVMAYTTMLPFFMPNVSIDQLTECTELDGNCFENMSQLLKNEDGEGNTYFTGVMLNNYSNGIRVSNLGLMFRQDIAIATDINNENFIIDYRYIFSTIVGVVVILLLITFCMDVAVRSIKLAFLQLIAPIPIISYVDPKSGKDGLFKKWYQMCFKTFLSLFIRLIAMYFAVYIISRIGSLVDIIDGSAQTNGFIKIFIMIGALMFAKQLPKILEGLGIKLDSDGKFTLNPFKKFEDNALGGKRLAGAVGGMVAGAVGGHGVGRLTSAFTGAARGFASNKGYKGGLDRQADVNRKLRDARINGAGFWGSRAAVLSSRYGLDDADLEKEAKQLRIDKRNIELASRDLDAKNKPLESNKKEIQASIAPQQSLISKKEKVKKSIEDMESFAVKQIESNKAGDVSDEYRRRKAVHQYLESNQGNALAFDVDIDGKKYYAGTVINPDLVSAADNSVGRYLNKIGKQKVMDDLLNHAYHDASAQAMFDTKRATYKSDIAIYNSEETDAAQRIREFDNYKDIHDQADAVEIGVQAKRESIKSEEAKIEQIDREIKQNQVDQKVSVNGREISVEEAQNEISAREKELKDKQEKRKLNRELAKSRRISGGS